MSSAAIALALLTLWIDRTVHADESLTIFWIRNGGPAEARTILGTIAGSMITVVGIVFSMTMVTLTLASNQFGPRLIRTFMGDLGTQFGLGAFIATFIYAVLVLQSIRADQQDPFIPSLSVTTSVLLTLANLFVLIFFIHHVGSSIQAPHVIAAVSRELEESIEHHFPPKPNTAGHVDQSIDAEQECAHEPDQNAATITAEESGYLQIIDLESLMEIAIEHDLKIWLTVRPGDFVMSESKLGIISPSERVDDECRQEMESAFIVGRQRTPPEDVEFLVNQLVEVAIRALSPSINDPFTAINCVDRLGSALCVLIGRQIPSRQRYDQENRLRITTKATRIEGIVNAAFDQIRQYGLTSPALTIRLLEVIAMVASRVGHQDDGAALLRQAVMIRRGALETITEPYDQDDINERFQTILDHLGIRDASAEVDRYITSPEATGQNSRGG